MYQQNTQTNLQFNVGYQMPARITMKKQLLIALLMLGFINTVYAKPNIQETIDYINVRAKLCQSYDRVEELEFGRQEDVRYRGDTVLEVNDRELTVKSDDRRDAKSNDRRDAGSAARRVTRNTQVLLKDLSPNVTTYGNTLYISCGGSANACISTNSKTMSDWGVSASDAILFKTSVRIANTSSSYFKQQFDKYAEQEGEKIAKDEYRLCRNTKKVKKIAKALSHLIKLSGGKEEFTF